MTVSSLLTEKNGGIDQRKSSSSQLSNKVLRDFSSEIFKTNAVKLARVIHVAATRKEAINIQVSCLQCFKNHIGLPFFVFLFVCFAYRLMCVLLEGFVYEINP